MKKKMLETISVSSQPSLKSLQILHVTIEKCAFVKIDAQMFKGAALVMPLLSLMRALMQSQPQSYMLE